MNALKSYPGLPHRMERIRDKDGVLFVNDSKATNPTATAPALAAFERIRWICGGQAKTDNLDECAPHFGHVAAAYTIGEDADLFERLLSPHMPVKNCGKLAQAVQEAGAFAVVAEGVVEPIAVALTQSLEIPVIGIGASAQCDGQVLVTEDMLGMFERVPRFVKRYEDLASVISKAAETYAGEVRSRAFPTADQTYQPK